jgi:hypothetical protein
MTSTTVWSITNLGLDGGQLLAKNLEQAVQQILLPLLPSEKNKTKKLNVLC